MKSSGQIFQSRNLGGKAQRYLVVSVYISLYIYIYINIHTFAYHYGQTNVQNKAFCKFTRK